MTSLTARKRFTNNKKTKQTWEYVLSIYSFSTLYQWHFVMLLQELIIQDKEPVIFSS